LIGLGVDGLRWKVPVRPDDMLRIEGEVVSLTPSKTKHQGTVLVKWTLYNQGRGSLHVHPDRFCALSTIDVISCDVRSAARPVAP